MKISEIRAIAQELIMMAGDEDNQLGEAVKSLCQLAQIQTEILDLMTDNIDPGVLRSVPNEVRNKLAILSDAASKIELEFDV